MLCFKQNAFDLPVQSCFDSVRISAKNGVRRIETLIMLINCPKLYGF